MKIDLVTATHPEDKRNNDMKYIFMAPVDSGLKEGDYVIVDSKSKISNLAKVVDILHNIDDKSELLDYIRSLSGIGDKKIKRVICKLEQKPLDWDEYDLETKNIDKYLAKVAISNISNVYNSLNSIMTVGDQYYYISIVYNDGKNYYTISNNPDLTYYPFKNGVVSINIRKYQNDEFDAERMDECNVFLDAAEASSIAFIIRNNINLSKESTIINIKEEIAKIKNRGI